MNKTKAITNINKIGKAGHIVSVIFEVIAIMVLALIILGTVIVWAIPDQTIKISSSTTSKTEVDLQKLFPNFTEAQYDELMEKAEGGSLSFQSSGNVSDSEFTMDGTIISVTSTDENDIYSFNNIYKVLVIAIIECAFALLSLLFAGFFFKALSKCQSPFEENVIKKMRNFAFSLIPWAVLSSISNSIANHMLSGSKNFSISLNITVVCVILVVLGFTYIFKYGAVLQQESDETL